MTPPPASEADPLAPLADEFLARRRRGEPADPEEYVARHPELASQIRDLFPALLAMEDLGGSSGGTPTVPPPAAPPPRRLGEYRVLRAVGRGGMGVVYEAVQEPLGRHVALKVLPAHLASAGTFLERFRREARAAARLHHTHIVPVFGVGEADGTHYYAMQFIHGQGLDRVLDDVRRLRLGGGPPTVLPADPNATLAASLVNGFDPGPVAAGAAPSTVVVGGANGSHTLARGKARYPLEVARLGTQVADALAYAHAQGVQHRDIKPSNLLLDTDGAVWVTDFGLAKADDAADLTGTGDLLGTLRYMPPERFAGVSDARGDVYALGVTLYELLALRPAFDEVDRGRLIRQVNHPRPPKLRKLAPDVPRDLETVIVKAMAPAPADRYATAAALADDLRRVIDGRSIKARRHSVPERVWRWGRRNPMVAGLLAAVVVLLSVLSVGGMVQNRRLTDALQTSEGLRSRAEAARREAREGQYRARLTEAHATRFSRRAGQRTGTLAAVREAVALARELDKGPEDLAALRTLAIAALALPDLAPDDLWSSDPAEPGWTPGPYALDPAFRLCAATERRGAVSLRRVGPTPEETGEVGRLPGLGVEAWPGWSPDGRYLAVWHPHAGHRLQVWRVADGRHVLVLDAVGMTGMTFTPDGRRAVVLADGRLRTYDLDAAAVGAVVPAPAGAVGWMAHHPHRPEVAVSARGGVVVVRPADGGEVARLETDGAPEEVVWHPHGELLAVVFGDRVEVWDVARGRRDWTLDHRGGGGRASFNAAGDLLATHGWGGRLRLWDPYTGRLLVDHAAAGFAAFGPGDRLSVPFAENDPGPARRLARADAGREYRTLVAGVGGGGAKDYHAVAAHPGGRLVAVATGQGLGLVDLAAGGERAFVPGNFFTPRFEPSGDLLTRGSAGLFRWPVRADPAAPGRWTVGPPEAVPVSFPAHHAGLDVSRDGGVLAAAAGDGARVWRRDRPRAAVRVGPHDDCRSVAVSPDGRWVATGSHSGFGLKVWEAATGRLERDVLPGGNLTIPAFSPDGRWLLNRTGESWEVGTWAPGPKRSWVGAVALAPAGHRLAAQGSQRGFVPLFDPDTGRELARLEDPHNDAIIPVFGPDGTKLFGHTNDGRCVRVWDLRLIRRGLADLDLDWERPAYPPGPPADPVAAPLDVRVEGARYLTDPVARDRHEREGLAVALWADPFDADARRRLGERLLAAGKAAEAYRHLAVALTLNPGLDAHDQLGKAAYQLRRWNDTRRAYTEHLRRHPGDPDAHHHRGHAHEYAGDFAAAAADFTAALAPKPADPHLLGVRAACFRLLGRAAEAEADARASLAANPDQPEANRNMAYLLLNGPADARDPEAALAFARRAVEREPDEPANHHAVGVALYRLGRWREAAAALEWGRLVRLGTSTAYFDFFLAMCRHRLGDPAGAKVAYDRGVAWEGRRRATLAEVHRAELAAFRAEAEAVLAGPPGPALAPPPREARPRR